MIKNKFLILCFLLYSTFIIIFSYNQVYQKRVYYEETKIRVALVKAAKAASNSIDKESLKQIYDMVALKVPGKEIEDTSSYKILINELDVVQSVFSSEISWYYIFKETEDENKVQYLLDSTDDVEQENTSVPGDEYDISNYEIMKKSIKNRTIEVEPEFGLGYDDTYKIYIVSAFVPIIFNGEFIGILGIDCFAENYEKMLRESVFISILITSSLALLAIIMPILLIILYLNVIYPFFARRKNNNYLQAQEMKKLLSKNKKHI